MRRVWILSQVSTDFVTIRRASLFTSRPNELRHLFPILAKELQSLKKVSTLFFCPQYLLFDWHSLGRHTNFTLSLDLSFPLWSSHGRLLYFEREICEKITVTRRLLVILFLFARQT